MTSSSRKAGKRLFTRSAETSWGDFFDAGLFIGALATPDPRHPEAYPLVEEARVGRLAVCTTNGILSEVYATLTWYHVVLPLTPQQAADAIRALLEPPSAIRILPDSRAAALRTLDLAAKHSLTARRIHDARHAATALVNGVVTVYTYDPDDWKAFAQDGLSVVGPASTLARPQTP